MSLLPPLLTHNYHPARGAFRNVCDLCDGDAEKILDEMRAQGRALKPDYLERRRATEGWLLRERTRKLGAPRLPRPIYFFVGDFADGQDLSRPCSWQLPLAAFPADAITFTYPDSMASLAIATRERHADIRKRCHGHVFTGDEIEAVLREFGLPERSSQGYVRFIEAQVWDGEPLRAAASASAAAALIPSCPDLFRASTSGRKSVPL